MSHIESIAATNWGPFQGSFEIQLPTGPIAVVGKRDRDPLSSNWLGKTWLLSTVRFALFGARPSSAETEDSWITLGQRTGSVSVQLSCGVMITRRRKMGASTQLEVLGLPGTTGIAKGERAQTALEEYLCMSLADFDASCWVAQKASAKLVLATPSARTAMVEAWIGVGPLRAAEVQAARECKALLAERDQMLTQAKALEDTAPVQLDVSQLKLALTSAQEREAAFTERAAQQTKRETLQRQVDEFHALVSKGETLAAEQKKLKRAELESAMTAATDTHADTQSALTLAEHELDALHERVEGKGFDGQCPVMCEVCPVADQVTQKTRSMKAQLDALEESFQRITETEHKQRNAKIVATKQLSQWDTNETELARVRERALQLESVVDEFEALGAATMSTISLAEAKREQQAAARALADAEASNRVRATALEKASKLREQVQPVQAQATTWAVAASVLRGARREVSEAAVIAIEAGANRMLSAAGIDLSVAFRWERESSGLASNCDKCGEGYPSSTTVRVCTRCSAPRPGKTVERLDLIPSDRSGAADDLAGLSVQLAAAAWLRARRGGPFSAVLVDEPFAALDTANARALGIRLHAALSELGFEQAIIVAHDAALMTSLPSQIVIRSDGRHSRVEVMV